MLTITAGLALLSKKAKSPIQLFLILVNPQGLHLIIPNVLRAFAIGVEVAIGLALAGVAAPATILLLPLIFPALMVGLAVLAMPFVAVYDPIVVVVLDDGRRTWINIGSWYE